MALSGFLPSLKKGTPSLVHTFYLLWYYMGLPPISGRSLLSYPWSKESSMWVTSPPWIFGARTHVLFTIRSSSSSSSALSALWWMNEKTKLGKINWKGETKYVRDKGETDKIRNTVWEYFIKIQTHSGAIRKMHTFIENTSILFYGSRENTLVQERH